MDIPLVNIKNLSFRYNTSSDFALKDISISLSEGSFTLLCGVSGSGKTTLLRLLKPELSPEGCSRGEILFSGTPLEKLDKKTSAFQIAFVPQDPDTGIITDKVSRELAFNLENMGMDPGLMNLRIAEICGYLGLSDKFSKSTGTLSGGEKQLLNLASALAVRPRLLLLDEPTAQLDPVSAANFLACLKRVNDETGVTVLITEHRLEETLSTADYAGVLEKGRLALYGKPRDVARKIYLSDSSLKPAVPAAAAVFTEIEGKGIPPLTVREGISYLKSLPGVGPSGNADDKSEVSVLSLPERVGSSDDTNYKRKQKPPSDTPVFNLKNCFFRYTAQGKDILNGLDLEAFAGEFICLLGANGAGKSTLLRILAGLDWVYSGKVRIFGENPKKLPANTFGRDICLLPQNPRAVFTDNTLKEELLSQLIGSPSEKIEDSSFFQNTVSLFSLEPLLGKNPLDLSGGELQKAAVCKLILRRPKVLLLDEPTKGLDVAAKYQIADILSDLSRKGTLIITATHDMDLAAGYADLCGMFFDGKLSMLHARSFFTANNCYTTSASRIATNLFPGVITTEELIRCIRELNKTNQI